MTATSRHPAKSESGFVMITVILVMVIALTLGGVAVADSLKGRSTSTRDLRAKRAQAAADAGVQQLIYRANLLNQSTLNFNGGVGGLTSSLVCALRVQTAVRLTVAGLTSADAAVACPAAVGPPPNPNQLPALERLGNREQFRGWYIPNAIASRAGGLGGVLLNPIVVAEGHDDMGTPSDESDDIIRRSEAILNPVDPFRVVEAMGSTTLNGVTTTLNGNMRSNLDMTVNSAVLVSHVLTGVNLLSAGGLVNTASIEYGRNYIPALLTVALPAPQRATTPFTRAAISVSSSKPDCGGALPSGTCPSAAYYSAATHKLNVPVGTTLTLASGDYVFCDVKVDGTLVTAQTGNATRIFVDSPASPRCTGLPTVGNLFVNALNPGVNTAPTRNQFYVVGNGSPNATTATIKGNLVSGLTQGFFLYAPDTRVDVTLTSFLGSIIGRDVTLRPVTGLAMVLTQDLNLYNAPLAAGVARVRQTQYVECAYTRVASNATADVTDQC